MIQIEEHVALADFATFRIGGPARYFARVTTVDELNEALDFAREGRLRLFILGGGSNILPADEGFPGLVIKMDIPGIHVPPTAKKAHTTKSSAVIVAGAGESWDELVNVSINKEYSGLENLSGIPGTVGGAVVGNIGAYGREVKDSLVWVDVIDTGVGNTKASAGKPQVKRYSVGDCAFSYRDSIFKHHKNLVVIQAAFGVGTMDKTSVTYPDLLRYFAGHPSGITPRAVRKAVLAIRAEKLPDISQLGTAGSFFKNPVISADEYTALKKRYPGIPSFPVPNSESVKVPAAWLLDKICGFKGKRWGAIGVYERQALVLVNFGGGTAREVATHAQEMVKSVMTVTGITLEPEVESVS